MMMTCRLLLIILIAVFCSVSLKAEKCVYINGQNIFEVTEASGKYEVVCRRDNAAITSRNKNILDRQFRMFAVDLIGAYILFKREKDVSTDTFQDFVDGVDLHYNAYVEGLKLEQRTISGKTCIVYTCDTNNYKIESATYNHDFLSSEN